MSLIIKAKYANIIILTLILVSSISKLLFAIAIIKNIEYYP